MTLPHERPEFQGKRSDGGFTTMNDEIAKHWGNTHPDYETEIPEPQVNTSLPRNVDPPPKKK
jgi:hypothetical protein